MRNQSRSRISLATLVLAGLTAACSSNGGSGSDFSGFELTRVSLPPNAVWEVNREIAFTFSEPVDFSSVSLNTINIQTSPGGAPATGSFRFDTVDLDGDGTEETIDQRTIVFQPNCPVEEDLSDSGLQTGGVDYTLTVVGRSGGASNTIRSQGGASLETTQIREFSTPASIDDAFLDSAIGPPDPVIRDQGSDDQDATYLEIGGDPDNRVYFEIDPAQNHVLSDPTFEAPLNLFSDESTHVALVIEFNQAVDAKASNINSDNLRLEYRDGSGNWHPLETKVTLVANCTETGARVRLEPVGILPPDSEIRGVVLPGFVDITGDATPVPNETFAVAPTMPVVFTTLIPPDDKSDEIVEPFDFGGTGEESFEDVEAIFLESKALWGGGELNAAFSFEGAGGPGGDFDWTVKTGERLTFDTTAQAISGGPPGGPIIVQRTVNGIVDVRNFTIEPGGQIRVQGPNPLRINASGDVIIRGRLDISGFDGPDVTELNSGNVVERGGAGVGGGGDGGDSNIVINNSSPRGGRGDGPFGRIGEGGQGGETAFAAFSAGKDARRPGGGGGGRFALDQTDRNITLRAEKGTDGTATSRGAEGGLPDGGQPGVGPFGLDITDDFFGSKPVVDASVPPVLLAVTRGELPSLWAGYGGGGGGNACPSNTFPTPNWTPGSDEKGGPGGGGGGGLHIRALGRIVFGSSGDILANGGRGGLGENTFQQDHVGGTGGSGSGGHVILETASVIDFTDASFGNPARDYVSAVGGPRTEGPPTSGGDVSFGGPGGPGVIQLHVPDPTKAPAASELLSDIVVPLEASQAEVPLEFVNSPIGIQLIPSFGAQSRARSEWIPIGGAAELPGGGQQSLEFLFEGVDLTLGDTEGKVLTSGGTVVEQPALLDDLVEGSAAVAIDSDELTLEIGGTTLDQLVSGTIGTLSSDIYLRTPALLRDYILRLYVAEDTSTAQDFNVADAAYDEASFVLRVTVENTAAGTLQDFFDANAGAGTIRFSLIPRFFRVVTGGVEGALPDTAFVRILFQGAADDGNGNPDETTPLVDWTADVSQFSAQAPGALQFLRFEVEFDLDAQGTGVSSDTQPVSLDFLKVPFLF